MTPEPDLLAPIKKESEELLVDEYVLAFNETNKVLVVSQTHKYDAGNVMRGRWVKHFCLNVGDPFYDYYYGMWMCQKINE